MKIHPDLVEQTSTLMFDFWERRRGRDHIPQKFEDLEPNFQAVWRSATIEEATFIIEGLLVQMWHFFNAQEDDIGAAHARALVRFADEELEHTLKP